MIKEFRDDLYNNVIYLQKLLSECYIYDEEIIEELNDIIYNICFAIDAANLDIFFCIDDIEFIWLLLTNHFLELESVLGDTIINNLLYYNIIKLLLKLHDYYLELEMYEYCHNIQLHIKYIEKAIDEQTTDN